MRSRLSTSWGTQDGGISTPAAICRATALRVCQASCKLPHLLASALISRRLPAASLFRSILQPALMCCSHLLCHFQVHMLRTLGGDASIAACSGDGPGCATCVGVLRTRRGSQVGQRAASLKLPGRSVGRCMGAGGRKAALNILPIAGLAGRPRACQLWRELHMVHTHSHFEVGVQL